MLIWSVMWGGLLELLWSGRRALGHLALGALMVLLAAATATAGCKPGLTELDLPDASHYCGQMKNGKLDGQGRLDWGNDHYYEGGFVGGRMEGQGTLRETTFVYEGQFKKGNMEGTGRLTYGNGQVYEGQFKNDKMDGQGKLTYDDGTVYEGQFKNDKMDGQGKLTYKDGTVYEGQFKDDKPNGKIRRIDDGMVTEGQYNGSRFVGPVVVTWPDGWRYEGSWENNAPNGQGVLTRPDKAVVRGTFRYGRIKDEGAITYPDGAVYTGPVDHGYAEGKGKLRRASGETYQGHFVHDQFDGQGQLKRSDGTVQTGYWREGKYLGAQGDGTLEDTPELSARNNEAALYNQQALLDKQFAQIKPSPAGGPAQMYALLVAGDGQEEVFRREVAYVDALLARRFGTGGRSVSLVNSRSSVARLPLATAHSMELALAALAQKMDRQRDLLFVYLTSHGSREHEFVLDLGNVDLPGLTPQRLRALLDATGVRNKVVVISACYAGGFIPALQGERTWVITAARADRASFGCTDKNDFTYFGRALFKESLANQPTLSAAFAHASKLVRQWESSSAGGDGDEQHSLPQSAVAPRFRAEVDAWFQSRPGVASP